MAEIRGRYNPYAINDVEDPLAFTTRVSQNQSPGTWPAGTGPGVYTPSVTGTTPGGNGPTSTNNPQTNPNVPYTGGNPLQFDWTAFNANIAANPGNYAGTSWDPTRRVIPWIATQNQGVDDGSVPDMEAVRRSTEAERMRLLAEQYNRPGYLANEIFTNLAGRATPQNQTPTFDSAVAAYSQPYYGTLAQNPDFQRNLAGLRTAYNTWRQANPNAALTGYGNSMPAGSGPQQPTYWYNPNSGAFEMAWGAAPGGGASAVPGGAPNWQSGAGMAADTPLMDNYSSGGPKTSAGTMQTQAVTRAPDVAQGVTPRNPNQPYVGGGGSMGASSGVQQTANLAGMSQPAAPTAPGASPVKRRGMTATLPWYL